MIVLAIDPGSSKAQVSHTGIVLLSGTKLLDSWAVPNGVDGFRTWMKRHHSFATGHNMATGGVFDLDDYQGYWQLDHIVCEQFVDRQVRGADRTPMLVEGAVRFLWPDVVLQSASGYKTAVPDDVLKALDLWKFPGKDHHDDRRAAARHAIRFLKNRHDPDVLAAFR